MPDRRRSEAQVQSVRYRHQKAKVLETEDCDCMQDVAGFAVTDDPNECDLVKDDVRTHIIPRIQITGCLQVVRVIPA